MKQVPPGRMVAVGLAILLVLLPPGTAPGALARAASASRPAESRGASPFQPYVVRVAKPHLLVPLGAVALVAAAEQAQAREVGGALAGLQARGLAGDYTFDGALAAYRAELAGAAAAELRADARVAAVQPGAPAVSLSSGSAAASRPQAPAWQQPPVSSVIFAEIHSPFVWGNTAVGGLNVQMTLRDYQGRVIGVPAAPASGSACAVPKDCVNVNPSLYFETTFVVTGTSQYVLIQPGDAISVTTSGVNPSTEHFESSSRLVHMVDIKASLGWNASPGSCATLASSPLTVTGTTSPTVPVTITIGTSLDVPNHYLTPGSGMTYAVVNSGKGGTFPRRRSEARPTRPTRR